MHCFQANLRTTSSFSRKWPLGLLLRTSVVASPAVYAQQLDTDDGTILEDEIEPPYVPPPAPSCEAGRIAPGEVIGAAGTGKEGCSESQPVAIGFRTNLGRDLERLQALVARNAALRIGWPAEFEMSRSVEDTRQIVLLDMLNPPTNNEAGRTERQGVLWRKISGGTDGQQGSRFVERVLTVVDTCRRQGKRVLDYLSACIESWRQDRVPPSLLPDTS